MDYKTPKMPKVKVSKKQTENKYATKQASMKPAKMASFTKSNMPPAKCKVRCK
jgi:hypothetical protein